MKILWVATKAPWPPVDGGRLLLLNTLEALAAAGHSVTLVAPVDPGEFDLATVRDAVAACCTPVLVPVRRRSLLSALVRSELDGVPLSIARHAVDAVRREVSRLLACGGFDLVQVEQAQALPQAGLELDGAVPVVLRAQNVDSDLWAAASRLHGLPHRLMRWQARRMIAWERSAVARPAATIALTDRDAERLRQLAGADGRIHCVRAPFAGRLPAGERPLPGSPPLVLMGSEGWLPNRDAVEWFVGEIWPAVAGALPEAVLHVFGARSGNGTAPALRYHPAPSDSRDLFAPGAILTVPLRVASGVRMKVLEAWARGVPVVATPEAAQGLDFEDGRELLLARDAEGFVRAIRRLHDEPTLAAELTAAGRATLARFHDPRVVVAELEAVYSRVLGQAAGQPQT